MKTKKTEQKKYIVLFIQDNQDPRGDYSDTPGYDWLISAYQTGHITSDLKEAKRMAHRAARDFLAQSNAGNPESERLSFDEAWRPCKGYRNSDMGWDYVYDTVFPTFIRIVEVK